MIDFVHLALTAALPTLAGIVITVTSPRWRAALKYAHCRRPGCGGPLLWAVTMGAAALPNIAALLLAANVMPVAVWLTFQLLPYLEPMSSEGTMAVYTVLVQATTTGVAALVLCGVWLAGFNLHLFSRLFAANPTSQETNHAGN